MLEKGWTARVLETLLFVFVWMIALLLYPLYRLVDHWRARYRGQQAALRRSAARQRFNHVRTGT